MVRLPFASMLADLAAAAVQVAHDVALIFFRRRILDLHDRLEQDRLGLLESILDRENRRQLERHFVRVDVVIGAVDDVDVDVDHLVAADHAVEHRFFDALLAGRDVFLRNRSADDLVLDRDAFAALVRAEP